MRDREGRRGHNKTTLFQNSAQCTETGRRVLDGSGRVSRDVIVCAQTHAYTSTLSLSSAYTAQRTRTLFLSTTVHSVEVFSSGLSVLPETEFGV